MLCRFQDRKSFESCLGGVRPVLGRRCHLTRLLEVVRHEFRLVFGSVGEPIDQRGRYAMMAGTPLGRIERFVGSIANQRVLEPVAGMRRLARTLNNVTRGQRAKRSLGLDLLADIGFFSLSIVLLMHVLPSLISKLREYTDDW